jgi:hypothetical protein
MSHIFFIFFELVTPDLDVPDSLEMIRTLENFRLGPGGGEYRLGYFCE